jgi:hypothetical protein
MVNDRLTTSGIDRGDLLRERAAGGTAMPDEARRLESARPALLPATVLVIDDDPAMVESLAMMLEDHGFRC